MRSQKKYCSRICQSNFKKGINAVPTGIKPVPNEWKFKVLIKKRCKTCNAYYISASQGNYCCAECRSNSPNNKSKRDKISASKKGVSRSDETKRKLRLAQIKYVEKRKLNGRPMYPVYNSKACDFFKRVNAILGVDGVYAENKGEYRDRELGFWYDYYCPEIKLIIEWDEKKHKNKAIQARDASKNEAILKWKPDFMLIRIDEESRVTPDEVVSFIRSIRKVA
jgi:hypothetical protein